MQAKTYKRNLFDTVVEHLDNKEFTLIAGARQTGKTTLLGQVAQHLQKKGKPVYQISLDDIAVLEALNKHPENLMQFVPEPRDRKIYVFIDEFQNLGDPSTFVGYLFDKMNSNLKIIGASASADYLDENIGGAFKNRMRVFNLYTLDFEEFLQFKSESDLLTEWYEIQSKEGYISYKRKNIEGLFNEYLTFGGYPAVVLAKKKEQKIALLKELANSYLKREIYESNIQNQEKLHKMFSILAFQTGSLVNMSELSNTLQLSITAIENYLHILRKSFHIQLVRPFYKNLKKELTKMPKVYFNDLGMRNVLINQFPMISERLDRKELVENYVFIRLRQKYEADKINYWRTADGNEVDFVVNDDKGFAIETKFNSVEYRTSKYKKFMKAYPEFPIQCRAYASDSNNDNVLGL